MPTQYPITKCVVCNTVPKDVRAHMRTKSHKANVAYQERHFGKSKVGPLRKATAVAGKPSKAGWNKARPGKKKV